MKIKDILSEYSPAEKIARSENKGNKVADRKIKEIRAKEKSGLITTREAEAMINRMTKSQKQLPGRKK